MTKTSPGPAIARWQDDCWPVCVDKADAAGRRRPVLRPPYPVECFAQGVLGGSRATASQGEWPWCSRQCGESGGRHVIIRSPGGRGWKHVNGGCQTGIRGASTRSGWAGLGWCACWRRGWASARVRDAVRGSAVSTWPRRREREATTKRRGPRREPGQGSGDAGRIREVSGPVSGRGGQQRHGGARLVGRRETAANGWLALIQTETRARHEPQQTGPG